MKNYYEGEYGNPHSTDHALGWKAKGAIDEAREEVASLVGGFPEDVIFTSGATEANNLAILGYRNQIKQSGRKVILCGSNEHKCVLRANQQLADEHDLQLKLLPVDNYGDLVWEDLEKLISEDVFIVSLMLVNNEIGTINDIERVASYCNRYGVKLHCDASQASVFYDMSRLSDACTTISLSSHKMYGPTGVGALIVSPVDRQNLTPLFFGGGQEQGYRSGTLSVPLCAGFGKASTIVTSEGFKADISKTSKLRDKFHTQILKINQSIQLNGPPLSNRHPLNLNLLFPGFHSEDLIARLQPIVCVSSGAACSSGATSASDTLLSLGLTEEQANCSIRFGFGIGNSEKEVDIVCELISDLTTKK